MIRLRDVALLHAVAILIAIIFVALGASVTSNMPGSLGSPAMWSIARTGLKYSYALLSSTLSVLVQLFVIAKLAGFTFTRGGNEMIDVSSLAILATQATVLWVLLK